METDRQDHEPAPHRRPGRPSKGPHVRKDITIPTGEWPRYAALVGGPLGATERAVLLALVRLGHAAHTAGLSLRDVIDD